MPELPDVEVYRRYLNRTALHKTVETTRVFDASVIKGVTARTVQRRLQGRTLESTERRGKHLLVDLGDGEVWLGLHFGMTGYLDYHKEADDTPEHTRVRLAFTNDYHLSYVCQRKFGEVRIVNHLDRFFEERDVGPDALEVGLDEFIERLRNRRGAVKPTLMNQAIVSGLGNVYTDEVLLSAGIHPECPVGDLDEKTLSGLYEEMKAVLEQAISAKADPNEMLDSFLLPNRSEGAACPRCSGSIKKIEVRSRPTYVCPSCQPSP